MASILVVDDEPGVRRFLADTLEMAGHVVAQAASADEAVEQARRRGFQVVLTDLRMPGSSGMDLLGVLRAEQPEVQVIVLTAHATVETAVAAMKLGAFDYLQKPISSPAELRLLVDRAVDRFRFQASREVAQRDEGPPLTYGAPAMDTVVRALRKVAPTEATVLLVGESGTGKEVAARAIHRWSARDAGPFVAVNCAALAETLLESELFGHEKGAYTGAVARRRGRIELADGGTFFLDEVGELAPALQAKFLRVLQERTFERVGGHQTIACNVRWIAATNRDLHAMIAAGRFREDLFHRLAVFPVRLPPLRERREDIAPLARALLIRIGASLGRPDLVLDAAACAALEASPWSGNVRELCNTLERAAILSDTGRLSVEHLAPFAPAGPATTWVPEIPAIEARSATMLTMVATRAEEAPVSMAEAERTTIRRALEHFGGNRRKVAEHLGIGLRTLYDKLKRYDLG
jgi:two-component system, NtrC family, response regulator AtoC